ncbi:MAG: hypothetical protein IJV27_04095 [Prevotella sp.]|nr:hypothetical protein [Prevotella sp.]
MKSGVEGVAGYVETTDFARCRKKKRYGKALLFYLEKYDQVEVQEK